MPGLRRELDRLRQYVEDRERANLSPRKEVVKARVKSLEDFLNAPTPRQAEENIRQLERTIARLTANRSSWLSSADKKKLATAKELLSLYTLRPQDRQKLTQEKLRLGKELDAKRLELMQSGKKANQSKVEKKNKRYKELVVAGYYWAALNEI